MIFCLKVYDCKKAFMTTNTVSANNGNRKQEKNKRIQK